MELTVRGKNLEITEALHVSYTHLTLTTKLEV